MLIIFTVNDQKVTHDLGQRTLVAGSSGVAKAAFTFDNSWDGLDVVVRCHFRDPQQSRCGRRLGDSKQAHQFLKEGVIPYASFKERAEPS